MILSRRLLLEAGGWNRDQLELLGIKWPPAKGWLNSLVGQEIPDETWNKILSIRGLPPGRRKPILRGQGFLFPPQ